MSNKLSLWLRNLCKSFDKEKRNWDGSKYYFYKVASLLTIEEWKNNKNGIRDEIQKLLNRRFTLRERLLYPFPNTEQYANNAIRDIEKRIYNLEHYKKDGKRIFIKISDIIM